MNLRKLVRDVDVLKKEMNSLRPSRSAGMATNTTTRGVTRRAITTPFDSKTDDNNNVARWA